jgi:transcriptional regulator with XRE-family HTH domain
MHYPTEAQVMEYINDARQGQGLSINALALLAGLSARTVAAKLAGERPARITDLYRFAVALGTTPARIYTELEDV